MNIKLKHMYCVSIDDQILDKILDLGYIPVGLGNSNFSSKWITDDQGENISWKNKYYGEYTFHYFFWKNLMHKIPENEWIGFCGYRRLWKNANHQNKNSNEKFLSTIPENWNQYDVIIGDKLSIKKVKWIKVLKYGKLALFKNPKILFNEKYRNIKFHFDMFHGEGLLDKAINQLSKEDKFDFKCYVEEKTSFNQGNMFITRSKKIMHRYYSTLFEWLSRCEKIFGFNLKGYQQSRLYAFLAERFLSYWFKKNTKYLEWPVIFYDLRK